MWYPVIVHGLSQQNSGDVKLPFQPLFILFQDVSALQVAWATHMVSLGTHEARPLLQNFFSSLRQYSKAFKMPLMGI